MTTSFARGIVPPSRKSRHREIGKIDRKSFGVPLNPRFLALVQTGALKIAQRSPQSTGLEFPRAKKWKGLGRLNFKSAPLSAEQIGRHLSLIGLVTDRHRIISYRGSLPRVSEFVGLVELGEETPDVEAKTEADYERFRREVRNFGKLPQGWDTYAGRPPGPASIEAALRFVDLVEKRSVSVEWVAPTSDDSILVVIQNLNGRQEWDFYSDGDIAVTIEDLSGQKKFLDVQARDIEAILSR